MPKNLDVEKPRDSGAIEELETAEAFLAEGLVRNAAGKAFQALKAFISYLALKNAALLAENTGATNRRGRTAAPFHERVAAVAPTDRLPETATLLEKAVSNITLALQLRIDTTAKPR
jgi:hypothetical protein